MTPITVVYCKTVFSAPALFLQISQPWHGSWIFEISYYFSVLLSSASKDAKIKGAKIM